MKLITSQFCFVIFFVDLDHRGFTTLKSIFLGSVTFLRRKSIIICKKYSTNIAYVIVQIYHRILVLRSVKKIIINLALLKIFYKEGSLRKHRHTLFNILVFCLLQIILAIFLHDDIRIFYA